MPMCIIFDTPHGNMIKENRLISELKIQYVEVVIERELLNGSTGQRQDIHSARCVMKLVPLHGNLPSS